MPAVDTNTPPKCRRFTYAYFYNVWHEIPTASTNHSARFTLRGRPHLDEHNKCYDNLNDTFGAWVEKYDKRSIQKIITAHNETSEYSEHYAKKKRK